MNAHGTSIRGVVTLALVLTTALLLTGCASRDTKEPTVRYSSELSRFLKTRDEGIYSESDRCLNLWRNYSVEVIDDEHLLFRRRDELWINKLRTRCPQLRGSGWETLSFEVSTGRTLCSLDSVREVQRGLWGWSGGTPCPLGDFHRVAEPFVQPVLEKL